MNLRMILVEVALRMILVEVALRMILVQRPMLVNLRMIRVPGVNKQAWVVFQYSHRHRI